MDVKALFNLSYGLYIIGAKDGGRNVGCVVNTVTQATANPVTVTVCINKDNYTNSCIKKTKAFSVSILSENTKENTIAAFGFSSSREIEKFTNIPYALTPAGLPYVSKGVCGFLQCKVIDIVENFTHTIFIAEVKEAENLSQELPMTYAYYHRVLKGKTPPKASSYSGPPEKPATSEGVYICDVCGYRYPGSKEEFEKLPDDYVCPLCGAAKSQFSLL